jgi:predicted ferric reductase
VGLTSNAVDWYVARASGVVAYLLLTVVVLVGLTMSGRVRLRQWPRFAVEDVHRFGGLLVGVFTTVHVLAIAADSYVPFSVRQIVVPFTADYRPVWTALGVVAAELLLALAVTNRLRKRLPYRYWRVAHRLNFVVWAAASVHGIAAGTDTTEAWLTTLYLGSTTAVVAGLALRLARGRAVPAPNARAGGLRPPARSARRSLS